MVNSNKILTVSYGTFSCTLEGFDDSFGTMKAIAEYFRDLAADDRYFGAEPPTPDTEMLARIAEREIARRVEAHREGDNIILRAGNGEALPQPAAAMAEPPPRAPQARADAAEQDRADASPPAMVESQPPAMTEAPEPVPASAATSAATEPTPQEAAPQHPAGEKTAGEQSPPPPAPPGAVAAQEPAPEITGEEEATAEEAVVEVTAEETVAEATGEEAVAEEIDPDSVVARLRRIRSVVVSSGGRYGPDDYSEDEHAQDFLSQTATDLQSVLEADDAIEEAAQAGAPAEEAEGADAGQAGEGSAPADDPFASLTARLLEEYTPEEAPTEAQEDAGGAEGAGAGEGAGAEEETASGEEPGSASDMGPPEGPEWPEAVPDTARERAMAQPDASLEDTLSQLLADAMPLEAGAQETKEQETSSADAPLILGEEAARAESAGSLAESLSDISEDDGERANEDEGEEDAPLGLFAEDGDGDADEEALSPEEEAELLRELADVEAELGTGRDQAGALPEGEISSGDVLPRDEQDDVARKARAESTGGEGQEHTEAGAPEGHHARARLEAAEEDSDLARLFEETDSHLKAPDASERRNAIQHLRAAVAATRAEKKAGRELSTSSDESSYRSDMAQVVRPRRPRRGDESPQTERPRARRPLAEERPAPLKLVAEQRIDAPHAPVRPRRVSSARPGAGADHRADGGFGDYAQRIGAKGLPELLEAAAAYLADIEGRDQFSRPMLMGKLNEIGGETFSREDGLRSFGQLLRDGKLRKLRGGRFAVTAETEFRAPARHAG